jgi:hypothetical protein
MVIDLTTPGIAFGSGKFRVDAEGNLYAGGTEGIEINGKENYIRFDSENGKIFSGGHNELNSKKDGFFLNNNGFSIGKNFHVTADGVVKVGPRNTDSDNPDIVDRHCWVINGSEYRTSYDGAGNPVIKNAILKYMPLNAKKIPVIQGATKITENGEVVTTERNVPLYETGLNGGILCDRKQEDGSIVSDTEIGEIIYVTDENGGIIYERNEYDEYLFERDDEGNIYCDRLQITEEGTYVKVSDTNEGEILYSDVPMYGSKGQNLYERNEQGYIIWIDEDKMPYLRDHNNKPITDSLGRSTLTTVLDVFGEESELKEAMGYYTPEDLENEENFEIEEMPNSYIGQGLNRFGRATWSLRDADEIYDDLVRDTFYSENPYNSAYIGTDGICLGKGFSVDENGNLIAGYGRFRELYINGFVSQDFSVITNLSFLATIVPGADGVSVLNISLNYESRDIIACVRRYKEPTAMGASLPLPSQQEEAKPTGFAAHNGTVCELVTYESESIPIPQLNVPQP